MEKKLKHLEFIQNAINRMANNSFIIKGWCITLVVALIALLEKENINNNYIPFSFIPLLFFWFLDAFFLKLNLKCKTTKNNIISSYKEDYFFDRKIREDRVLDDLDRLFQN